jgi:hypothetical protein
MFISFCIPRFYSGAEGLPWQPGESTNKKEQSLGRTPHQHASL